MTFAENLRKARQRKTIKEKDLAKICNVSPTTYSGWENGSRQPRISKIRILCHALDVSADYLLGLSSEDIRDNLFTLSTLREPDPLAGLNDKNRTAVEITIGCLLDNQRMEEIEKRKRIVIPFRKHEE